LQTRISKTTFKSVEDLLKKAQFLKYINLVGVMEDKKAADDIVQQRK
jgi:hypothetical protein